MTPDTEHSIEEYHRQDVTIFEAAKGRYPCLVWDVDKAKFWVMAEDDEGYDLQLCSLSSFPCPYPVDLPEDSRRIPQHNIDLELGNSSLEDIMGLESVGYGKNTDWQFLATFLLQEGLAPNQPFQLEMKLWYRGTTSMEWIGTEWEMECDWNIIGREHLEPEEAAQRWEAYLRAGNEFERLHRNELG